MWIDWRDALADISGALTHHLDELQTALLYLPQFVVGGEHSERRNDDSSSIDETGLPSLLWRAFTKAFLDGPEESVAWDRALRCALVALIVAGCYVHHFLQLGRLSTADEDEPATSQQDDGADDSCYFLSPPMLQPSTPATSEALADDDIDDHYQDENEDDESSEEESPLAARTSSHAMAFDSLPRKSIFRTNNCTQRMNEWSRGVTTAMPPSTLDAWRHRLWCADDNDDGDDLLRLFCGALWFRFHVRGDKMEEIINGANDLLGFVSPSKTAPFERLETINFVSIVKWAYRSGGNGHCPVWLDRLLETICHALRLLAECCESRLHVPTCCLQQLIMEILRSDASFIRRYHEHNRYASASATAETPRPHPHPDTMQTVLRATARRLQSHVVLLNVIQEQHDGTVRVNYRNHHPGDSSHEPGTSSTAPPPTSSFARGELECSLNLVHWCVASGMVRSDPSAVLGLLRQERLVRGRILQLGVPRTVNSWFRDLRNVELAMRDDLQASIDPESKAQCVRVMAMCAIDTFNGDHAVCKDRMDDLANACYRLGMCLAHNDVECRLAVECLEMSHQVWFPMLRRAVVETIPQRVKALEAAFSNLDGNVGDDCRNKPKLQSLQALLRSAHTYLTTDTPASSTNNSVSPYWKVVQVMIELESSVVDAGFPIGGCGTPSYLDLEEAQKRLHNILEETGRLCRCMASILPLLSLHSHGDAGERGTMDLHANEMASLGRAIERFSVHKSRF